MSVIYKCTKCGKRFDLGWEGIFGEDEKPICDRCAGVERDLEGYAWHPGETEHIYVPVDDPYGTEHIVTREEAFGGGE